MENYREYLPELKTTTIFQDIEDEALIAMLEAMGPAIVCKKTGDMPQPMDKDKFQILLRRSDIGLNDIEPRRFKYQMPRFGEPGFLMHEIPSLSRFMEALPPNRKPAHTPKPAEHDMAALEFSVDMLLNYYNAEVWPAQQMFLRNLLGMLAHKVMDVRQELFLLRDGRDIFN